VTSPAVAMASLSILVMVDGGKSVSLPATVSWRRPPDLHVLCILSVGKASATVSAASHPNHLSLSITIHIFMSFVKEESPATFALPDEKGNVSEVQTRTEKVKEAISLGDWDALRALSLLPGGFGDARMEAW
jgi:hypothetical protein